MPDLAGDVVFDATGHHRAREDYGGKEKLEASSIEGSGEAGTARWRPQAQLGGVELAAVRVLGTGGGSAKGPRC